MGAALAVVLAAGAAVAVAFHVAGGGGHLVAVGPTNSEHGFPVWYEDGNGLTLDLCVDPADPMCLAAPLPNPDQPIAFPGNFPDESSWFNAGAQMDTNGGGRRGSCWASRPPLPVAPRRPATRSASAASAM